MQYDKEEEDDYKGFILPSRKRHVLDDFYDGGY